MNLCYRFCKFGLVSALLIALPAMRAADATLLKSSGSVTVKLPGGDVKTLQDGAVIPSGSTVITGSGGEAYVQTMDGAIATLKANTTLEIGTGKETVNLKSGRLVSTIDPAKKPAYSVRTPKGVAAARGTGFVTEATDGNVSITATADVVTFTLSSGATYSVSAGMISITPPGSTEPAAPVSLAQAAATNPEVIQVVQAAVQTIATVVQNNMGNLSAQSATNLAAQVVAVASATAPSQAAAFTTQVVTAMTASTASTAASANVAAVVATAAAQAAPQQAAQVAAAAATAAPQQAAVVTAAVSQVVPAAQTATVAAVAQATNQSTESVQAAATNAASEATTVVTTTTQATTNVVTTPSATTTPSTSTTTTETKTETKTETPTDTTTTPQVDPSQTSNASSST